MSRLAATIFVVSMATVSATGTMTAKAQSPLDWSGFYVGGQLGLLQANGTIDPFLPAPDAFTNEQTTLQQGLGGLYAGFNVQDGNIVWGIEGDVNVKVGEGTDTFSGDLSIAPGWRTTSSWEATLRARAGVLASESMLVFATAGVGVSDFDLDNPGCPGCAAWSTEDLYGDVRAGAVVGAGVEYAANEDVRVKLEYIHTFYPTQTLDIGPPGYDTDLSQGAVRAGISLALH